MARNNTKLLAAKCILYTELLKLDPEEATDQELDLMLALVRDKQIDQVLGKALTKQ